MYIWSDAHSIYCMILPCVTWIWMQLYAYIYTVMSSYMQKIHTYTGVYHLDSSKIEILAFSYTWWSTKYTPSPWRILGGPPSIRPAPGRILGGPPSIRRAHMGVYLMVNPSYDQPWSYVFLRIYVHVTVYMYAYIIMYGGPPC